MFSHYLKCLLGKLWRLSCHGTWICVVTQTTKNVNNATPNNPMNHSRSLGGSRTVIVLLSLCCKSAFPRTSGHLVSTWAFSWGRVEAVEVFRWNWGLKVLLKGKGWEGRCQLISWFWALAFTHVSRHHQDFCERRKKIRVTVSTQ